MLTLVDKAVLVKFFYLNQESAIEASRQIRTQKGVKNGTFPVTPPGLLSFVQRFEETERLRNRLLRGAPLLSVARNAVVISQIHTLIEHSTSGASSAREVQIITYIIKTSVFRILHGVKNLCPY